MLAEERLCKRRSDAASMQLYGGGAPLPAALLEPPSSQILRAACGKLSAQSLGGVWTCVSSYGISWARSFKKAMFEENTPRRVAGSRPGLLGGWG